MPKSVTGIELLAFAGAILAALAFIGLLFAAFLTADRPPGGHSSDME